MSVSMGCAPSLYSFTSTRATTPSARLGVDAGVFLCEAMTIDTCPLRRVASRDAVASQDVRSTCRRREVSGIAAPSMGARDAARASLRLVTGVIERHALWNRADQQLVRLAVGGPRHLRLRSRELSISANEVTEPRPTVVHAAPIDEAPEAFFIGEQRARLRGGVSISPPTHVMLAAQPSCSRHVRTFCYVACCHGRERNRIMGRVQP